jgi:dihydrofolate reductase
MRTITVIENVTLDGVMQAPGRPDEDPRGGFAHGGWAAAFHDPVVQARMGEGLVRPAALLFGRRTYDDFHGFWPHQKDNPFTPVLNARTKYVASRTATGPLPWENSVLLRGEATETVAALKDEDGDDLLVLGSGALVRALARADLVDRYVLSIFPIVLGTGQRLFDEGTAARLRLADSVAGPSGVILATYERTTDARD